MASALAEKEKRLASLRKARTVAISAAQRQQHTLVAVGSAYGLGWAEKSKFKLPTIPNVAPEVVYGSGSLVAAYFLKNKQGQRIAQSMADGMLSVALYKAGRYDFNVLFSVPKTKAKEKAKAEGDRY